MMEEGGISVREVARRAEVNPGSVSAVVRRQSGQGGHQVSRAARGRVVGTVLAMYRQLSIANSQLPIANDPDLDPMRKCLECRQPYEEQADGVIVCGCEGAERFPAGKGLSADCADSADGLREAFMGVLRRRAQELTANA